VTSREEPDGSSDDRQSTFISVTNLGLEDALWSQALADAARDRPLYFWKGISTHDGEAERPDADEIRTWLPEGSRIVGAREDEMVTQLLAHYDACAIEVFAGRERVRVAVAADETTRARQVGQDILARVPQPTSKPDNVAIDVWSGDDTTIDVSGMTISAPRWSEIEGNYPASTRVELARLMTMERTRHGHQGGRLILFHGPPGTGKSYAIRALIREWKDWCFPELVVDPERAFRDYRYLRRLLDHRGGPFGMTKRPPWRIVIAEDADRFVRADHRKTENEALDRLLNATDGILGQGSRTLFVLTTNMELATVNPALARPGRCLASIPFEAFGAAEAREWLGDGKEPPSGQTTLAELYQVRSEADGPTNRTRTAYGQYL
jgi:hypothetical protein